MPKDPRQWPSHGHAKNARDDSAEMAQTIRKRAYNLSKKLEEETLTDAELLFGLIDIAILASDILRLLEGQGAPTIPDTPNTLH